MMNCTWDWEICISYEWFGKPDRCNVVVYKDSENRLLSQLPLCDDDPTIVSAWELETLREKIVGAIVRKHRSKIKILP